MKDDRLYLLHVNECIDHIQAFTADGKEAFFTDRKTRDAVLRNLHTLSESVQRISEGLKRNYPQVQWREITGFRNVIVHDYLGIDLIQIWDIVERDLPVLKSQVTAILDTLGP